MTPSLAGSMEFGNVSLHRDQKVCVVQKELHREGRGGVGLSPLRCPSASFPCLLPNLFRVEISEIERDI